jgi:hypothetical protein
MSCSCSETSHQALKASFEIFLRSTLPTASEASGGPKFVQYGRFRMWMRDCPLCHSTLCFKQILEGEV